MNSLKQMISENTPISIGLLMTIIGGIFWLTNLYAQTISNSNALHRIENNQDRYTQNLEQINMRLSHIEGALGTNK